MADPYKLTAEDGKRHVWACGVCNHTAVDERHAKTCCACAKCGKRGMRRHYLLCDECEAVKQQKVAKSRHVRDLRTLAAVTLVDLAEYDVDQVCLTENGEEGSYRHPTDCCEDEDGVERAWVWACTVTTLGIGTFDAHDLVSGATEEWFEGAVENFDVDGLQKLLDGWCESQKRVECFYADETRIVVLDPARRAEVEAMVAEAKRELAEAGDADALRRLLAGPLLDGGSDV